MTGNLLTEAVIMSQHTEALIVNGVVRAEENMDINAAAPGRPAGGQALGSDRPWSIETNGIDPIAEDERRGRPNELFRIWCAANISILDITYGAFLVVLQPRPDAGDPRDDRRHRAVVSARRLHEPGRQAR
jgi:hypothetical protein